MNEHGEDDGALEISEESPEFYIGDFNFWISVGGDQSKAAFKGKATWRIGTLGKRPHVAVTFTLRGTTYQMRLYPNREACGPSAAVIERELKKRALLDAAKYDTFVPADVELWERRTPIATTEKGRGTQGASGSNDGGKESGDRGPNGGQQGPGGGSGEGAS